MAVSMLYAGQLNEAIKLYEKSIDLAPTLINENVLLNLSTLYELQSSDSKDKKIELLKKINLHKADLNINLDFCLKL